jgi:hypothetical protein
MSYSLVAMAVHEMIVGKPTGLHEGINDGRSHETEPAFLEILGNLFGNRRCSQYIS